MEKRPTFGDIPDEYANLDTARVVLVPVPYDGTSTWIKGADRGPDAFLDAAANMELYDIETDTEVYKKGIYLADPVLEDSSPEAMTEAVDATVSAYLEKGKFVTLFGGEHSISIGSIRSFMRRYSDLTVLQYDAHTDLRPEFHGSACNHACAVYEASKNANLVQVGIRSMDSSELEHLDRYKTFFAHDIAPDLSHGWMREVKDLCTEHVYITIDLDVFDPSIMPSTGTPEPGGLSWYQVLESVKMVNRHKKIVGLDIVELCPNPSAKASDFLAAKLYYKILSYIFAE